MSFLSRFRGRPRPRLTGLSVLVAGASWDWTESERDAVRDLIIFLEDRRSLFGPLMERVDPYYAAHSVDTIRNELTRTLQRLPEEAKSAILIDDMRAACRVFVDVVGSP